jgi:hypothetical protein
MPARGRYSLTRSFKRRSGGSVTAAEIIRLPQRCTAAIFIVCADDGSWLTLASSHGWLFGSRHEALAEAWWLSKNLSLPIRYQQPK